MNKEKNKSIVENEVVKELKEGADGLDIVGVDVPGLVSMIKEHKIKMYDDVDYTINDVMKDIIESKASSNSVFVIDIGAIFRRYKLWMSNMPRVKVFYAVKCNPNKLLLNTLVDLNVGFDVASKEEMSIICREFKVDPKKIIFANPVKEVNHITFAESEGIKKMTFDNEDELKKISTFHPNAELVLRILVDDSRAKLPFGSKFGCPKSNLEGVFMLAKMLELNIIGVSFHVGSGCDDPNAYHDAISLSRDVFNIAKEYGFDMYLLDIGGGFPGHAVIDCDEKFTGIASTINKALDELFYDIPQLEVIAEPGRFFATSCGILATNVIGRKILTDIDNNRMIHYYINSNLYGLFNNIVFDKANPTIEVLKTIKDDDPLIKSVIFGQTCDSMDRIKDNIMLPELSCGNWLIIKNHGAYTLAAASKFNGFEPADIDYVFTY